VGVQAVAVVVEVDRAGPGCVQRDHEAGLPIVDQACVRHPHSLPDLDRFHRCLHAPANLCVGCMRLIPAKHLAGFDVEGDRDAIEGREIDAGCPCGIQRVRGGVGDAGAFGQGADGQALVPRQFADT
jgi:hypothetical protein